MPRRVLDGAVDARACAELIALSRACGRQGFRAATRAATLSDVARAVPAGAAPLVEAREAVREAAEEWLGCFPGELHVQFTALIDWHEGAAIGAHADNCVERSRDYSAVLYLNGPDGSGSSAVAPACTGAATASRCSSRAPTFVGGLFRFADGSTVRPAAGRLSLYSAGESDAHAVERVARGARHTLTLWLTRDAGEAREDAAAIEAIREGLAAQDEDADGGERIPRHAQPFLAGADAPFVVRDQSGAPSTVRCGACGERFGDWRSLGAHSVGMPPRVRERRAPAARDILVEAVGAQTLRRWELRTREALPRWARDGVLA